MHVCFSILNMDTSGESESSGAFVQPLWYNKSGWLGKTVLMVKLDSFLLFPHFSNTSGTASFSFTYIPNKGVAF